MTKTRQKQESLKKLEELNDEISFSDYEHKNLFEFICYLQPINEKKIVKAIDIKDNEKFKKKGVVYLIVIEDKIFKIGHSIRSIKERIESYNSGKKVPKNSNSGGETNRFILQSILNLGVKASVYIHFPKYESTLKVGEDEELKDDSFPPSRRIEKILHENFEKKYKKLPIGSKVK